MGDVRKEGDKEVVCWKSTRGSGGHKINVGTLVPEPDLFIEDAKKKHGQTMPHIKSEHSMEHSKEED